ncbi:lasso peptide biosynthesis B2 protein (plasmid) [Brevundimonas staleyi]|uniref:Lasso peptide biosynthesis B2 protein n=1 Tax=Brevundimonas staleyi TaxID=74326 RepID=A0ABW0FRQ8_9CAUL
MMLALSRCASYCVFDDRTFILDLGTGRYYCVVGPANEAFLRVVAAERWLLGDEALLEGFVRIGVLVSATKPIRSSPAVITAACSSALDERGESGRWIPSAFLNQMTARASLKLFRLGKIVERIERRRPIVSHHNPAGSEELERSVARACQVVRRLTAAKDQCLTSSIAMLNVLASQRTFPNLVFGIKAAPFEAHCWVQSGTRVLNDTLENIGLYTPIRVV